VEGGVLVLWVVGGVERVRDKCEVLVVSCSFQASCSCSCSCWEVEYWEVGCRILVVVLHKKDDEQVVVQHEDVDAAGKKELVGPLPLLDVSFFP
jgi:hypothetical protein